MDRIDIDLMRDYMVVKDNRLIQNVQKRRRELSATDQKVLGFLLAQIKPPIGETVPRYEYEFDVRLFCRVCGIYEDSGSNYARVREALERVASNGFWISDGDTSLYFQWIHSPKIRKRSGRVSVRISEDVMPYLYGLRGRFTQYGLYQSLAMKSAYSIALFELLKSYAYRGSVSFDLCELRQYLNITDKYKAWRDFRREMLEPALAEINAYTDIEASYQAKKTGRAVSALTFVIKQKSVPASKDAYWRALAELDTAGVPGQLTLFGN